MSTQLFKEGLRRFDTDFDWVDAFFSQFVYICNLNSGDIFHRHYLVRRVFWISLRGLDVTELRPVEVFSGIL